MLMKTTRRVLVDEKRESAILICVIRVYLRLNIFGLATAEGSYAC